MIRRFTVSLFLLASLITVAGAQTPPGVNVKLSFAENKTVYRIGEPIKLVMEFTADREGYIVEFLPDGNEPGSDTVVVSPDIGITRWFDELSESIHYGRHVFSTDKLTATPKRVEITINDRLRFDEGAAGDERLLEARLKRWREEWRDRLAEADAQNQGQIERELIWALINGKSWKFPPERVEELRTSCITYLCKQSNLVRQ